MKTALGSDPKLNRDGLVDRFKDQLLIVMLKRLGGGPLQIPIEEMDRNGSSVVSPCRQRLRLKFTQTALGWPQLACTRPRRLRARPGRLRPFR